MDHAAERVEEVIEDLSRHLGVMVQGWMAQIQEAKSVTLDEMERGVREGMQSLGGEALQPLGCTPFQTGA
jgi:hypothetical protein